MFSLSLSPSISSFHQCICYDITNYSTFESIQRWVKKLQQEADKNCFIVLVGNKADLVEQDPSLRKVDKAEAKRYAQTIDAEVFEASAKTGTNVADIFSHVRFDAGKCETVILHLHRVLSLHS
jgi:small GTP-binding protein